MTNLLINAIQHSAPGATVSVTIVRRDTLVEMSVANPGEPIDPARRSHVFERFYRLEEARANSKENHGPGCRSSRPSPRCTAAAYSSHARAASTRSASVSTKPCAGAAAPADRHETRPAHAPSALH